MKLTTDQQKYLEMVKEKLSKKSKDFGRSYLRGALMVKGDANVTLCLLKLQKENENRKD